MRQIAYWKTADSKYQLRLFENSRIRPPSYHYETDDGTRKIETMFLRDAIRHVKKHILAYWPSTAIRQH